MLASKIISGIYVGNDLNVFCIIVPLLMYPVSPNALQILIFSHFKLHTNMHAGIKIVNVHCICSKAQHVDMHAHVIKVIYGGKG